MKICFSLILIASCVFCQGQTLSTAFQNEEIISSTDLRCGGKPFNLAVIYRNEKKHINLTSKNKLIKTIDLPTQSDFNGFSLNWAKKTKEGFELSVEYGSRIYFQISFSFVCNKNEFYLRRIKTNTFDKANPETTWKTHNEKIIPNLSLEKFEITDYLKL